ncbi:MAG: MFS transporter [Rhizobiaceae bacterium]
MDRRLIWLGAGAFITSTVAFVFSSLLHAIADDTGVSITSAGHLITAYSLSYAIAAPLLSALTGTLDRRSVMVGSMAVFVGGTVIAATSTGFGSLLAAQVVMGAAAALFAATGQATAVGLVAPEFRARAVSVVLAGTTLAVALGAPVGSLIATFWGWHGTFIALGTLGALCAVILWWKLPGDLRGTALPLAERLSVIAHPGVANALGVTFFYIVGGFTVISYLAPLALEGAGLSPAALPGMLLAYGFGAVVGNLSAGQLADRIGATRVVIFAIAVSTMLSLGMAVALKVLPMHLAGPVLIGLMVPWGISGWTFPSAQADRLVALAPHLAQLTLALNASALYFGIGVGSFVGGQVLDHATPADLGVAGAVFPLLALGLLYLSRQRRGLAATPAE